MNNINDSYFHGYYKDIWKEIIPKELTVKEVDFIQQYFNLQPNCKVLDIMCGYGRHAIPLAEKGIAVTGVDNLTEYVSELSQIATERSLPITAFQSDIVEFKSFDSFDLAIWMGNSLNFFQANDIKIILQNVFSQLKVGGHLLIHSWSISEIVTKQFVSKGWNYVNGMKLLTDSKFLFHPTRIETETIIIDIDGKSESKLAIDYIFSLSELTDLLLSAGFTGLEYFSIPGKKQYSFGDTRIYITVTK